MAYHCCSCGQTSQMNNAGTCIFCGNLLASIQAPAEDPWVQVGTTTIDGNLKHVYEALGVSPQPWICASDTTDAVDNFMRSEQPWLIGGRHLRGVRAQWDTHGDSAVIHCDVVRRRSDLDAEMTAAISMFSDALSVTMHAKGTCPECGPHGGAGRVLLLESWVDCTTCRPQLYDGDVNGEGIPVIADALNKAIGDARAALSASLIAEGASNEVAAKGVRAFMAGLQLDCAVRTPRGDGVVKYRAEHDDHYRVSLPGQGHVWFPRNQIEAIE